MAELLHRAYSLLNVKAIKDAADDWIIEGIASTPTPDAVDDIVEPMGARFTIPMPLLWQHESQKPVGQVKFARPNPEGIPYVATLPKIKEPGIVKQRVDEAVQSIQYRLVGAVSIGFSPVEGAVERLKSGGLRFKEWIWRELSLVTIPANAEATITSIKSADLAAIRAASGAGRVLRLDTQPGDSGQQKARRKGVLYLD